MLETDTWDFNGQEVLPRSYKRYRIYEFLDGRLHLCTIPPQMLSY